MSEWMTVAQAAEALGVNPSRVRQLCIAGRIKSQKFGKVWMVDAEAVRYRAANPSPHRRKS